MAVCYLQFRAHNNGYWKPVFLRSINNRNKWLNLCYFRSIVTLILLFIHRRKFVIHRVLGVQFFNLLKFLRTYSKRVALEEKLMLSPVVWQGQSGPVCKDSKSSLPLRHTGFVCSPQRWARVHCTP